MWHSKETHLHFLAPWGWPPLHQPQDVEAHVVLAASSEAEAKAWGAPIQVYAVIPGVTLGDEGVSKKEDWWASLQVILYVVNDGAALTFGRDLWPFLLLWPGSYSLGSERLVESEKDVYWC